MYPFGINKNVRSVKSRRETLKRAFQGGELIQVRLGKAGTPLVGSMSRFSSMLQNSAQSFLPWTTDTVGFFTPSFATIHYIYYTLPLDQVVREKRLGYKGVLQL